MKTRTNTAKWDEKSQRWRISVQKDGNRKYFYSSVKGRNGQREANAKADKWLESGVQDNKQVETLYAEYQQYVEDTAGKTAISHVKTFGKNWILPNIGKIKIDKLCDGDIQKILDKANAKGLSRKTIMDINATINAFLKYCRRQKATTFHPEEVQIPKSARYKGKNILQPSSLITLFNIDTTVYKGKRVKDKYINAYRFQVLTGVRPGELRAINRRAVKGRTVYIKEAINEHGETTKGKNENAVRKVILSDMAYNVMQDQLEASSEEYFFEIPAGNVYRKAFKRYCDANNIEYVTPYELRHTFVSVAKNLPVGEVKELVGHSKDFDTFGVYGHAITGEDMKISADLNDTFSRIINKSV